MKRELVFEPQHGFGVLDLLEREPGHLRRSEIPYWLVDRRDVLEALLAIHDAGATRYLDATGFQEVVVDLTHRSVSRREPVE